MEMTEKKKNTLKVAAIVALVLCVACAGLYAAVTSTLKVKNNYQVGVVSIAQTEGVILKNGVEVVKPAAVTLKDDETLVRKITITNTGEPCYIRCKNTYTSPLGEIAATAYAGADAKWQLAADGYVYYTMPLNPGDSVEFAETLATPAQWLGAGASAFDMDAHFCAEAVQAANFTPVFDAAAPWGDVVPEASVYSTNQGGVA